MEICTVNAHEVGVLQRNDKTTDENKTSSNQRQLSRGCGTLLAAGTALEPTLVLANHACEDPTMLRVNVGGRGTWAFAARDIKEGEEVKEST